MSYHIFKSQNDEYDHIKLLPLSKNDDFVTYNINFNNRILLFKTPFLYSSHNNNYHNISLGFLFNNTYHLDFYNNIISFELYVFKLFASIFDNLNTDISKFIKHQFELVYDPITQISQNPIKTTKDSYFANKSYYKYPKSDYYFLHSVKSNDDRFYPPFIKTKYNTLQIFDILNNKQNIDYLLPGSYISSLIQPKSVWIRLSTNEIGITWYIHQIKIKQPLPILNECLLEIDNNNLCYNCCQKIGGNKYPPLSHTLSPPPPPPPPPPPLSSSSSLISNINLNYLKYFKMLKMGIPLIAVKQKCQLDGLDTKYLDDNKHVDISKIKIDEQSNITNTLPFTSDDLINTSKKLNKISGDNKDSSSNSKNENKIENDPRIPSLDTILNQLKKLKKTNINKKKY